MRRALLLRGLPAAVLLLLVGAGAHYAPRALRRLDFFTVRRVEISGTHLLAPHQVLAASGVRPGQNLWDDPSAWVAALRAQPAIAAVHISRRLPHTLRIRVEEKRAVALVEAGVLTPVTASGQLLPVDPARAGVDLPLLRGAWAGLGDARRRLLLGVADRLGRADPGLCAEVSEIRAGGAGVVILRHRLGEILLPADADATRLAELHAVLADLARRLPATPAPAHVRVDLRFAGQVVVRLPSSASTL